MHFGGLERKLDHWMCLVDDYWEIKVEVKEILSLLALGWIHNLIQLILFAQLLLPKPLRARREYDLRWLRKVLVQIALYGTL